MKDSVLLAVDVLLPKQGADPKPLPTLVYFVRYVRSIEPKGFFKLFVGKRIFQHVPKKELEFFTRHGYACVIVDLRGSGASFGYRNMEFSPEEVADMSTVFDWIVAQPWSDGQTATTGISYTGTTAELALSSQHPSLKACIPRSNIFDLYEDMNFPGGIRQTPFIEIWKNTTQALDRGDFSLFGSRAKMAVKGTNPVDGDRKRQQLQAALKEHEKNFDVFSGILRVTYRNEIDTGAGAAMDDYSIHNRLEAIRASKVPIYRISGWYDGALSNSVLKGWANTPDQSRVLLGPWDHGPAYELDPYGSTEEVSFNVYQEMLRFLDYHVKSIKNGLDQQPPIHYFQLGTQTWKSTENWKNAQGLLQDFYLQPNAKLSVSPPTMATGHTRYQIDDRVSTPNTSRWNSLTVLYKNGPTNYPDRRLMNENMVVFDSLPLEQPMTIVGHPRLDLYCTVDAADAQLFAYLEAVSPTGEVVYITEGLFRAIHRKESTAPRPYTWWGPYHSYHLEDAAPLEPGEVARLRFMMIPTAFTIKKGYHLRLSIAGADVAHFHALEEAPEQLLLHHDATHPSKLQLPIQH